MLYSNSGHESPGLGEWYINHRITNTGVQSVKPLDWLLFELHQYWYYNSNGFDSRTKRCTAVGQLIVASVASLWCSIPGHNYNSQEKQTGIINGSKSVAHQNPRVHYFPLPFTGPILFLSIGPALEQKVSEKSCLGILLMCWRFFANNWFTCYLKKLLHKSSFVVQNGLQNSKWNKKSFSLLLCVCDGLHGMLVQPVSHLTQTFLKYNLHEETFR